MMTGAEAAYFASARYSLRERWLGLLTCLQAYRC